LRAIFAAHDPTQIVRLTVPRWSIAKRDLEEPGTAARPLVRKLANGLECHLPYQFRVIAPIIDFIKTNRHTVRVERQ